MHGLLRRNLTLRGFGGLAVNLVLLAEVVRKDELLELSEPRDWPDENVTERRGLSPDNYEAPGPAISWKILLAAIDHFTALASYNSATICTGSKPSMPAHTG